MNKVNYETNWQIESERATVIDFKGFLTGKEIMDIYGKDFLSDYYLNGTFCDKNLLIINSSGATELSLNCVKIIVDPATRKRKEISEDLALSQMVSLDKMKHYNDLAKEAENRFNDLVERKQRKQELERS
jgi:hypothetical protein